MKTAKKGEWFQLIIPKDWNQFTIDHILREVWHGPKKLIHQLKMEKLVTVNGEQINWHKPLNSGDRFELKFFSEEEFGVIPAYFDIDVLYEDDHLLIVNKPQGMDTHPNEPSQTNTLANAVAFYLQAKGEYRRVLHIHRLDKDTTGAILFAKHSFIGAILDRMLEERQIKRTYVALVEGHIARRKATINQPIGKDRHHPTRRRISQTGQTAITHYKVLKEYKSKKCTLIQCRLDTGRTHQIRVHLSSIGHPLLGDVLYGSEASFPRQALHAIRLAFIHPLTGEKIECFAPFIDEPGIFPSEAFELINVHKDDTY
ncbi:RluA family pseudouridine synthase [Bacillus sp. DNRA2]|uniref:RluA family pseudouridine synthase n=1 Tax=Bacillus sp. DNRA2 TaxID=2723053 RepID=UPI00145F6999|nr:RluA family pseudouridine synthase [Bacillus sp. DNRA2]NMD72002.1 RluA family pseudouridine synthase [Bacillus sp. DNRA2]